MGDKVLFETCIKTLVLLSLLYSKGEIDEDTYTNHLKLKIRFINDFFNKEIKLN
jgi:hypothetical protein